MTNPDDSLRIWLRASATRAGMYWVRLRGTCIVPDDPNASLLAVMSGLDPYRPSVCWKRRDGSAFVAASGFPSYQHRTGPNPRWALIVEDDLDTRLGELAAQLIEAIGDPRQAKLAAEIASSISDPPGTVWEFEVSPRVDEVVRGVTSVELPANAGQIARTAEERIDANCPHVRKSMTEAIRGGQHGWSTVAATYNPSAESLTGRGSWVALPHSPPVQSSAQQHGEHGGHANRSNFISVILRKLSRGLNDSS